MSFSESMYRTILFCATVVVVLLAASYIVNIEERVTNLEDRASNGIVIPMPDLNCIRNRPVEGEPTQ